MHRTQDERARILIVVESPEAGTRLGNLISNSRDMQCVGTATDKPSALRIYEQERPNVVVAGLYSPQGHTLGTIQHLSLERRAPVLGVCQNSAEGARLGIEVLQRGALDIVDSPADSDLLLRDELYARIRAILLRGGSSQPTSEVTAPFRNTCARASAALTSSAAAQQRLQEAERSVVVVATGAGGPKALLQIFPALTNPLPPLLVAQPLSTHLAVALAEQLDLCSTIRCKVAENGEILQPNTAYLTPAGRQTVLVRQNRLPTLLVHTDFPQQPGRRRENANVLMQSAAIAYGDKCLGLLMTGNGRDGVDGARAVTVGGGFVLAQDEESCFASGTVRLAGKLNYIDRSMPLHEIAEALHSVTPILGRPEISVVRSPLFDPGPLHTCAV